MPCHAICIQCKAADATDQQRIKNTKVSLACKLSAGRNNQQPKKSRPNTRVGVPALLGCLHTQDGWLLYKKGVGGGGPHPLAVRTHVATGRIERNTQKKTSIHSNRQRPFRVITASAIDDSCRGNLELPRAEAAGGRDTLLEGLEATAGERCGDARARGHGVVGAEVGLDGGVRGRGLGGRHGADGRVDVDRGRDDLFGARLGDGGQGRLVDGRCRHKGRGSGRADGSGFDGRGRGADGLVS